MVAFYKHDIPHWMDGTEALSDGAYRAYHIICQLIYLQEGPIVLNERGLAGRCNQRRDRFRRYLEELVAAGKLRIVDGKVENIRANTEIAEINRKRKRISNGTARAYNSSVADSTAHIEADNLLNLLDVGEVQSPIDKTRQEEKRNTPPTPPSGVLDEEWVEFECKWATSDARAPGAREVFAGLDPPDRRAAIDGIAGFRAEEDKLKRGALRARRYLAERRWGITARTSPKRLPVAPEWPNWKLWKAEFELTGKRFSLKLMAECERGDRAFVLVDCDWPPGYKPTEAEAAALVVVQSRLNRKPTDRLT